VKDDVDHHITAPGLEEPLLGRPLGPHPRGRKGFKRTLGVRWFDHQIQVVLRQRAAPRPSREAAGEHERQACVAHRGNRDSDRLEKSFGWMLDVHRAIGYPAQAALTRARTGSQTR
jgi:hypothetical protein